MYKLGLIGYPITHSLSPWIHENFLKKAHLDGSYSIIEIGLDQSFEQEIKKLRDQNINGFNVTIPYKQAIIPFIDELDIEAKQIGAVNTVVNKDGKWIGYNTDGIGFLRALYNKYPFVKEKKASKVLILGAGGAARGIYYALMMDHFKNIDIANRTVASAQKIAELKNEQTETSVLTLDEAEKIIHTYDIIIQTSSVGMRPNVEQSIIEITNLKENAVVSDIVYQPLETKLLKDAKNCGANIHYGHSMLLYQAQYAFEIWTSKLFNIDDMDEQLYDELKGR